MRIPHEVNLDRLPILLTALCFGVAAVRLYCALMLDRWRRRALHAEGHVAVLQADVEALGAQVRERDEALATTKEVYLASLERNSELMAAFGKCQQIRTALLETLRRRDEAAAKASA
jgi:hypothetical protein